MQKLFESFVKKETLFTKRDTVLLAVSGGCDSVVMCELFYKAGFSFAIAHCNFQLRGKESDTDELFVKKLAKKYKAPFFSVRFETKKYAKKTASSTQMAARELRYRWFEEIRSKNNFSTIATAHHQDDVAETFLINLLRGSGIGGFHGIAAKKGNVIRPLLFTDRKQIEAFAKKHKLAFREDSSNKSDDYLRNKIRHNIIPLLKEINPSASKTVYDTTLKIAAAEEIYRQQIESVSKKALQKRGEEVHLSIAVLKKLSPFETYLYELLAPFGFTFNVTNSICDSLQSHPGQVFLSPTHRLLKDRESLIIQPIKEAAENIEYKIPSGTKKLNSPIAISIKRMGITNSFKIPTDKNVACLDADKLKFPLILRKWQKGDSFYPLGMKQKKKLSDFLIDSKLSLFEKENVYVLLSENKICWVVGHRIDQRYKIDEKAKEATFFQI